MTLIRWTNVGIMWAVLFTKRFQKALSQRNFVHGHNVIADICSRVVQFSPNKSSVCQRNANHPLAISQCNWLILVQHGFNFIKIRISFDNNFDSFSISIFTRFCILQYVLSRNTFVHSKNENIP